MEFEKFQSLCDFLNINTFYEFSFLSCKSATIIFYVYLNMKFSLIIKNIIIFEKKRFDYKLNFVLS